MINDNKILSKFFALINVEPLTSVINGSIFLGEKPVNRKKEDVVIGLLTNEQTNNDSMQIGVLNINCYTIQTSYQTRDIERINTITDSVISAFGLKNSIGTAGVLSYEIEQIKTFRDNEDPDMFFTNIRLLFSNKN